ncbi:ABC transporter substrate-binding protein [Cupriavidus sp. USMAHM13]|uniref:ABC transporter substrate-binding protein n=1 Tax=Cupriavidus malaysiensis TaxID=367825 RepID=A0A1D9ICA9_9BURK|nr:MULTISPECIES: tripartite tricarboxylate transporter substrate binding protein [Cupriavidus]AOZ02864.1 ABC transporter substrate-binding protein [Cupriavidus sp. USMAHM13]AOZ09764.1 ABC transporter substrate-binding protein [Cupriavidus malaysiensis]
MKQSLAAALALTAALSASFAAAPALAAYPDHPVTLVVPYAAGGSNDLVARVLGQRLSRELGVSVVVDNAPGASGTIGAVKTVNAAPDGYTLLLGSNSEISIARLTNPRIRYDGQRDLVPLRMVGSQPMVLVSGAQSGIRGIDGFLALAKSHKPVNYGTSGIGTPLHLSGELIRSASKVNMAHVPYKGGAPAIADLMANQIELGVLVLSTALPQIKSGKLQAIGVTSAARSHAAPNIPALAENKALAGIDMRLWFGVFAPAATPKAVTDRLSEALAHAINDPEVKGRLSEAGVDIDAKDGAAFRAFIAKETEAYRKIVSEANIQE